MALLPATAGAEWQFKPFAGVNFGGSTTYFDLENVVGHAKFTFGGNVTLLGEILGVEADFGNTSGYFNGDTNLVVTSGVTTLTGNVVAALPKRVAQYSLRPYLVAGVGLIHPSVQTVGDPFALSKSLPAIDIGAGATGFLSEHVGVNWDVRVFRSFNGPSGGAFEVDPREPERLTTWRATMGIVFRP